MQLTKNFQLQEFIPKTMYGLYGDKSIWFINPKLPVIAQLLKDTLCEEYETNVLVNINTWNSQGSRQYSGRRPYNIDSEIGGARESQHKMGNAIDVQCFINGKQIPSKDIHAIILKNEKQFMEAGLTTLENVAYTKTWNHLDCRWTNLNKLLIVNP